MDSKNLSSNWKKLQETLKKKDVSAPSTKRKNPDQAPRNAAVKKRKRDGREEKTKPDRPRIPTKRKRMSEGPGSGTERDAPEPASRSRNAKPNEGRSST